MWEGFLSKGEETVGQKKNPPIKQKKNQNKTTKKKTQGTLAVD